MTSKASKGTGFESLAGALLEREGIAVFEHLGQGRFCPIGRVPEWFWGLEAVGPDSASILKLGESFPFLENFLVDADDAWAKKSSDGADSGTWIEKSKDGREMALEATAIWLLNRPVLYLCNPQTPYQEQHAWLQTARDSKLQHERLVREIQKKEILLHCIVHDLSQPLTALRGCFSCLEMLGIPENCKELVDIGLRQTHMQEGMIRGILETFSGELAAQQAGAAATDVARCAAETVRDFAAAFQERSAHIQLDPNLDLSQDWKIAADESRLRRVWTNLVENALRYSPPNSTVTLGVLDEGSSVRAFVDDEGPGLPGGDEPTRLFALFSKGKEGSGKAGLGLYFCRITVERWGGRIGCESKPERGSRFWFQLRRAERERVTAAGAAAGAAQPPEIPPAEPREAPALDNNWRPLRVLVAEDVEANRQLISLMLEQRGHQPTAVVHGRDALAALEGDRFDAVLTDDEMPEMDGSDLVRTIRDRERNSSRHLPIIVISGAWEAGARERFTRLGADGCLTKPFQPDGLYDTLEGQFFAPSARPTVAPDTATQPGHAAVTPVQVLDRFKQNERFVRSLVSVFLRDSARRMEEIRKAVARQDRKALARAVHGLSGSADMLGAGRFADLARELQAAAEQDDAPSAGELSVKLANEFASLRKQLAALTGAGPKRPAKRSTRSGSGTRRR